MRGRLHHRRRDREAERAKEKGERVARKQLGLSIRLWIAVRADSERFSSFHIYVHGLFGYITSVYLSVVRVYNGAVGGMQLPVKQ